MEIILMLGIVIVIGLQVVILSKVGVNKEVKEEISDFLEDSPYTRPGSPFYTNDVLTNKEGDE